MYRASADVDFVVDPTADQLEALAEALGDEFYVYRDAMAEARRQPGTFNAIHEATSFKIDFFLKGPTAFDAEELRRSIRQRLGADPPIMIKSPEDTILRKLEWFRRGGGASDRQWHDVVSILGALRGRLDEGYLDHWAGDLGVTDLLDRARRESAGL